MLLFLLPVGANDTWLSKTITNDDEDEDQEDEEKTPLSKVAKGIPKFNKSLDESKGTPSIGDSDIDFSKADDIPASGRTKSVKRGSTARAPIKLSGEVSSSHLLILVRDLLVTQFSSKVLLKDS